METKKIIKNASYLLVGNTAVRFILAIATILFARYAGAEEYGVLSIALALSAILGYLSDAGLTQTFMREGTKKETDLEVLVSSYLRVRVVLAIIISILTFFFIPFFYHGYGVKEIIFWIVIPSIYGITLRGVGTTYFQATERMEFTASIFVLQGLLNSLALLLGMLLKWSVVFVAAMYGIGSMLTGIISIILVLRYAKIHRGWNKNILDQLLVFTVNGVIVMIIPQLGPIILEKVTSLKEVGFFSAAFKIPSVLYQIPGVIASAFYPRLFAYGNAGDVEGHRNLSILELKLMSFIGILISLPFILNPNFWIVKLLGEEWIHSAEALAILAFMVILQSINIPLADFLTTKGNQLMRTISMIIGFIIAIVCYMVLGTKFGMIGGAMATIITEFTLMLGLCCFIPKGARLLLNGTLFNIFSFIISYLVYYLYLRNLYPIIAIVLTGTIYLVCVILMDKQISQTIKRGIRSKLNN